MGQRVNIQYSIDIDDLPTAVAKLLEGAITDLTGVTTDLVANGVTAKGVMELSTLRAIQDLRANIERIDHTLGDVGGLISSYISYHTAPPQAEEAEAETKTEDPQSAGVPEEYMLSPLQGHTTGNDLDNLQTQIERFREAIADPSEGPNEATS
jgi:hypothetical protein|tara:strand:+ start:1953 stop:2411 length:459 start_codon:yes stop_codon:yes gene_type:complete